MVAQELKGNVLTIHKLLEYEREFDKVWDAEKKQFKTKVTFFPTRGRSNPLPQSLRLIVIDESSTVSTSLFKQLEAAAPHCQFIFIGDINQLPPVGDDSIFGYKLLELPTVELTEVYRQALESKPLALAHRVLSGKAIYTPELKADWADHPDLQIKFFPKGTSSEDALLGSAGILKKMFTEGKYDPVNDVVLCPFNVGFGITELNKHIMDFAFPDRIVWEVIAGYETHYLAEGDYVLWNKDEYIVTKINPNGSYSGRRPSLLPCDRWGRLKAGTEAKDSDEPDVLDMIAADGSVNQSGAHEIEFDLEAVANDDDRVNAASHVIHLRHVETPEGGQEILVSKSGDVNQISFPYATTVHKSQGSGWERVFIFLHASHRKMLSRELLYTAITRVKKQLYIFCELNTFVKGITNARIPGTNALEKAKFFQARLEEKALEAGDDESEED